MENRKNTILLTVIAVATLLVAVVGATFAYFTAQGNNSASANVNVRTATADSSSFGTWSAITITADQDNFAKGEPDQTGTSTGSVTFTANSEAAASFCYSVTLAVDTNTFVYTMPSNETSWNEWVTAGRAEGDYNEANKPELIFTAKKTVSGTATNLIDNEDITVIGASQTAIQIPTTVGGTEMIHRIDAGKGETITHAWELTVTLKNRNWDQSYDNNGVHNTGKSFVGAVKFTRETCPATETP